MMFSIVSTISFNKGLSLKPQPVNFTSISLATLVHVTASSCRGV